MHFDERKYGQGDADQIKLLNGVLDRNAVFGTKKKRSMSQEVGKSLSDRIKQQMRRKSSSRKSNFSGISETSRNLLNKLNHLNKTPTPDEKVSDGTLVESDLENTLKNTRAPVNADFVHSRSARDVTNTGREDQPTLLNQNSRRAIKHSRTSKAIARPSDNNFAKVDPLDDLAMKLDEL